jgi:hypothetical protein
MASISVTHYSDRGAPCAAAERALIELVGAGVARRTQLGEEALWQIA